jgi:hypothetical protein
MLRAVQERRQERTMARWEWGALLLVVATGLGLRVFRLGWGLPDYSFPDAVIHFIRPAAQAAAGGGGPEPFVHPSGVRVLLTAAFRLWSTATGEPIRLGRGQTLPQLGELTLVGRTLMVVCAAASIVVLYAAARRLVGARAALLAAVCFALAPLHVLESHRVGPDVPMILLQLVAFALALRGGTWDVLGGFAAAGLAAATKYTGVFAAAVPAWVVRARVGLLLVGGLVTGLGFALGCIPCLTQFESFVRSLRLIGSLGYVVGMPGVDLTGDWPQLRWIYPLLVALPFALGWAVHLAALGGLAVLAVRQRPAAGVLLAAIVPYFLFMGGAVSAVPRYYMLLIPPLTIAAGAGLDRLIGWRPRVGIVVSVLVLGYTALLSASHVARLGLGPQREVAALVARRAADAAAEGRKLVVAYPNGVALLYDALGPLLRRPQVEVVPFPEPYGHPGEEGEFHPPEDLSDAAAWFAERGVEIVIVPSWVASAIRRTRPGGAAERFLDRLEADGFGMRLAARFRTAYLTERLYTWGDPMLDTHWETGIAGYDVFVRAAAR